jgi:small-conductance mechanosensitive channel
MFIVLRKYISSGKYVIIAFCILLNVCSSASGQKDSQSKDSAATRVLPVKSVPDDELEKRLKSVLSKIDDFKKIRITVHDGVVTLSGIVSRSESKRKIEQLVSRFEGVLYVNNKIEETPEIEDRLVPVLTRLRDYVAVFVNKLPMVAIAFIVFLVFWIVSGLIEKIVPELRWFGENKLARSLLARLLRAIVLLVGLLLILDILDIAALVGAVLGVAGLAGLAIGFAFKDIVENYLAGIILSLRRPFSVNDYISIEKHEGKIVRMTSRETILMTLDGIYILIPNATVFKSVILNYSRNFLRMFSFAMNVGSHENLQRVRETGLKALESMNGVLADPFPFMRVENVGDFGVEVRFFGWMDQRLNDYLKVKSEAIRIVKVALDKEGIDLPLPTSAVYLKYPDESKKVEKPGAAEHVQTDISVDSQIEKQIEKDLASSSEPNLLSNQGSKDD